MNLGLLYRISAILIIVMFIPSCSDNGYENEIFKVGNAEVTLLVTPNGFGDNGYGDDAANGLFAFMKERGVPIRLLMPKDIAEAEKLYRQWITKNASRDSSVLVVGSAAYEDILRRNSAELTGQGSRVLLFESQEKIDGVSTVMINRYGASYLAGAMSNEFDVFILAAAPGFKSLEDAIKGFCDGHESANNGVRKVELQYLADGENGFAMPDSAYHVIYNRADNTFYDEMIFPLLGGSERGVIKYLNSDEFATALMVGMDVDHTGQSSRIPFSMIIHIGDVLKDYLNAWFLGEEWPETQILGLSEGAVEISLTPNFAEHLNIWDKRYESDEIFKNLYTQYYNEAIIREKDYENRK